MAKRATKPKAAPVSPAADWRVETLAIIRRLILKVDPEIVEERKWVKPTNPQGVPVWLRGGIVCTGETCKEAVKLTFFRGAALADPQGLFNASLKAGTRRAIDIRVGEKLDPKAFEALIRAAVAANLGEESPKAKPAKKTTTKVKPAEAADNDVPVRLLQGGNPKIAKAEGEAPVQAYIAAIKGWRGDVAARVDALIVQTVPHVRKAVKWNSPFYGIEGQGWFASIHVFTKCVKLTFFKGTSLKPPPGGGSAKEARWVDIHEHDMDEAQIKAWLEQAAGIPGWMA